MRSSALLGGGGDVFRMLRDVWSRRPTPLIQSGPGKLPRQLFPTAVSCAENRKPQLASHCDEYSLDEADIRIRESDETGGGPPPGQETDATALRTFIA